MSLDYASKMPAGKLTWFDTIITTEAAIRLPEKSSKSGALDGLTLGIHAVGRYGPCTRYYPFPVIRRRLAAADLPADRTMAQSYVPHFHNTPGVPVIEIGAKEFMCVGEKPPFDHPHVFLDMGDAPEIICPYCSTLFRFDPALHGHGARPPECALVRRI